MTGTGVALHATGWGGKGWAGSNCHREILKMLMTLAVVLLILWALGFLAFNVGGSLIHLLLVVALIVIVFRLVSGRRPVV